MLFRVVRVALLEDKKVFQEKGRGARRTPERSPKGKQTSDPIDPTTPVPALDNGDHTQNTPPEMTPINETPERTSKRVS